MGLSTSVTELLGIERPLLQAPMSGYATPELAAAVSKAGGLGADVVIAQGAEAGGHRGSFLADGQVGLVGTLALVPQVVDAVEVPVVAAGGIADGRGLAAVLALGASAANIGTAFLACPESAVPAFYREALNDAGDDSTTLTRTFSGRPARTLRNRLAELDAPALPFPTQMALTAPLAQAAAERGSAELMPIWAGQAAALAQAVPAGELVARICEDAERVRAAGQP
ncbi:MAG TPA: nitronate monooxygenase [Thermoleophilaceae bacterium]